MSTPEVIAIIVGLSIVLILLMWANSTPPASTTSEVKSQPWRVWLRDHASEPMTAQEVLGMWKAGTIHLDTLLQLQGDARGWTALSEYKGYLEYYAQLQTPAASPSLKETVAADGYTITQLFGVVLVVIGVAIGFTGVTMDVTVTAETGRSINNIGLISERLMLVVVAGFASLIGVVMMLMGGKAKAAQ